jgi:hypothetical protein
MNKYIEIVLGLVFLLVPMFAWMIDFAGLGTAALTFLKGGIIWGLIGIGLIFLLIGFHDLKD